MPAPQWSAATRMAAWLALALLLSFQPASASSAAPATAQDDDMFMVVHVTGVRAAPWKNYRAMRAALAAYEAGKALAPDATFSFAVLPPTGLTLPPDFKLRVRTLEGREFPIAVQDGELFQLPELPDPTVKAEVVSNVRGGRLRIGLLVHTQGVPLEQERLGDVRLRCEITEAIANAESFRRRHGGFCTRPGAIILHRPRAPTSAAWIVQGQTRTALQVDKSRRAYEIPVGNRKWGNDAIIEFMFREPLRPLKLSEVAIYEARE